jgi:hypothetical protein
VTKFSGIQWKTPPSALKKGIKERNEAMLQAVFDLAVNQGGIILSQARMGAPWTDRTGNARSGLFTAVEGFGRSTVTSGGRVRNMGTGRFQSLHSQGQMGVKPNELVIVLGHTMYYGVFLELSNGGRYAIVMATIDSNAPKFFQAVKELVG